MPVTYTIDADEKVIRTTCTNPLSLQDVLDHFRELRDDPGFSGTMDVLLDVNAVEGPPERAEMGPIITELGAVAEKASFRVCSIVAGRDAMFGMMRVFEVFASRYFRAIRVFRGLADAEQWLLAQRRAYEARPHDASGAIGA